MREKKHELLLNRKRKFGGGLKYEYTVQLIRNNRIYEYYKIGVHDMDGKNKD